MKKQKKKSNKLNHKLGDIHTFGNIYYETRFINRGIAFLCPFDDSPEHHLYYCCAELKLYPDGKLTKL